MKLDYKVPAGFKLNKRLSDKSSTCVTCERCGSNESRFDDYLHELTRSLSRHVCSLPTVRKKDLYFHEVPEQWPYASKGHHPADIPSLAKWVLALPATFRVELIEFILTGKAEE